MILDPDEPLPQARSPRQSLIFTSRGWAVIGQPTAKAEAWIKGARDDMEALFPAMGEDARLRAASVMACGLVKQGALTDA